MNFVRHICCFFIAFFLLLNSTANAQTLGTINNPFDAGTFSRCQSTNYANHQSSMSGFNNNIGEPSNDAWYKFILTDSLEISIDLCASLVTDTRLYLLNASYVQIASNDNYGPICNSLKSSLKLTLPAGTYYAAMEGDGYGGPNDLTININVVGQPYPSGTSIANAIDAGIFGDCSGRSFKDVRNNSSSCYSSTVGSASNDIFYRFVVTEMREVEISHCGSNFDTNIHLLNSSGATIASNNDNGPLCSGAQASIKMTLNPGTYYVVSEGSGISTGNILTNIVVKPSTSLIGYTKDNPIIAGEFSGCVNRSYSDGRQSNTCRVSGPIYYKIEVLDDADISISTCLSGGYSQLRVMTLSGKVMAFNNGNGPICSGSASLKTSLASGTYLVELLNSGFSKIDINVVSRNSVGSTFNNPIVVRTLEPGDIFKSTLNNSRCYGNEMGQASNDIYYKVVIPSASELSISHCGSTIDTYMHLLDASGNAIQVNNDNGPLCSGTAASMKVNLNAGIYYVVSEGNGSVGGVITTTISVVYTEVCIPLASKLSKGQNFIVTYTPRQPFLEGTNFDQKSTCEVMQNVQYFDGLGRPQQTVLTKGSPTGRDIIQPFARDFMGREAIKLQPYTASGNSGSFRVNALLPNGQADFYNSPPVGIATTTKPYSRAVFEASPLNRVAEQGAPGGDWQPIDGSTAGHTIKLEYSSNAAGEVKLWNINAADNGAVSSSGYEVGMLSKTISKDENWQPSDLKAGTIEEFKDFEGRVVLKRIWETDIKSLSTYYVYDDYNNLRYVLPPAINENGQSPVSSFDETQPVFKNFIYGYRYDGQRRMIKKNIPGKDEEYMVYNTLDQLVLSQDANQRLNNQWLFNKYDALGRITTTGVYTDGAGQVALQATMNTQAILWEARTGNNYDNLAFPQNNVEVYTINYYDDYTFDLGSFPQPSGSQVNTGQTKGLTTGSRVLVLGTTTQLLSVNYYDAEGLLVQVRSENHLSGTDVIDNGYNFAKELIVSNRTHIANGITTTIAGTYIYDHMGRAVSTKKSINGASPIVMSENVYNEIGQLIEKKLHNNQQNVEYAYNERGWLTGINSPQNVAANKVFGMTLNYANQPNAYNGNIGSVSWKTKVPSGLGLSEDTQTFTYEYDKLSRLKKAVYNNANISNKFDEEIAYDVMGNITSLKRKNGANGYLNELSYNYGAGATLGNKLFSVSDVGTGGHTSSYTYDGNGNQNTNSKIGITSISYNFLNLPQVLTKGATGETLNYTYDATGKKLRKQFGAAITDYVAGIQYNNSIIDFIQTEEGRAVQSGSSYTYEYFLKDHLGNTRAVVKQDGSIAQVQDYYAFGLEMNPGNRYVSSPENRYTYNGKEKQTELGLDQLDYGARFYDPVVGRFTTIDPVAEHFTWMTSYQYASNNSIKNIDLDGLEGIPYFLFGNNTVVPRLAPLAETTRVPTALSNLAKASGEVGGKSITELVGKATETAVKASQEHHVMPRQLKNNEVIEAAREGGFKFEGAENKITLERFSKSTGEGQHGNHPNYNKGIGEKLGEFVKNNPEYTTTDALKFVRGLVKDMKQQLQNNPATKVNDIFRLTVPLDNTRVVIPLFVRPTETTKKYDMSIWVKPIN